MGGGLRPLVHVLFTEYGDVRSPFSKEVEP